jgi:predicted membrane channel-forming protein YqfA (hemolysin III family)
VNDTPTPETHFNQDSAVQGPTGLSTRHFITPLVAVAAWLVPGLGHVLLRRWGRGLLIFLAVAGLALTGFYARGQVFPPHSDDPFGTLGFLADACSGVFFVIAHLIEKTGPDVSRAAGDYGTRFVAAAGLVNLLAVLDACGIALGRRN